MSFRVKVEDVAGRYNQIDNPPILGTFVYQQVDHDVWNSVVNDAQVWDLIHQVWTHLRLQIHEHTD